MTKKEVQKRVLQNGKPIALNKFTWDSETKTFSSNENNLVIDFNGQSYCTFKTGYNCTFKTGSGCTFNTGASCTFKTWSDCTFNTGSGCTFNTWSDCTFNTWSDCTFKTGSGCTFKTGSECVVVRRDVFEVHHLDENKKYQLLPYEIKGMLTAEKDSDKWYNNDGERCVVIDGIYSKVVSEKKSVLKVINHGEENESYVVTDGEEWAHGKTIKEAKESLIYKISDRDTSKYEGFTLKTKVNLEDGIKMYRRITGACESQTKEFVNNLTDKKESYTVKEIIELTQSQYGSSEFKEFF